MESDATHTALGTHYELIGDASAPVVVLIHGLGLDSTLFDDFVEPLSQDYRVLRYDLWGHGQSPVADTASLTVFAKQLLDLMDALSIDEASIVGFSLGGMINRKLALMAPARVRSLVILNAPHRRDAQEQARVEQRALDTQSGGAKATLDATLQRWFSQGFIDAQPEKIAAVAQRVLSNAPDYYAKSRFVLANGVLELIAPQPPIKAPCLVMTSENDSGSTPAMSEAMAAEIDAAELKIVPELKHLALMERPELFLAPIEAFLQTLYSK